MVEKCQKSSPPSASTLRKHNPHIVFMCKDPRLVMKVETTEETHFLFGVLDLSHLHPHIFVVL